jgi:hypothetical protein
MLLSRIPGREGPKEYFRRAIERGRLSHAYLFVGPQGSGKSIFARELAKAFFCETGEPCGVCPSCLGIEHGNHPSVNVYGPAPGKQIVDIDTVRELSEQTHYRTKKVLVSILERADLLNEPAANALLKTLEEPPGDAVLILTARSAGSMLPTIVSRCHRVLFSRTAAEPEPLAPGIREALDAAGSPGFHAGTDVRAWLTGLFPEEEGARGALRRLLDLLAEEERSRVAGRTGLDLDGTLARLESLIELRQDIERNVSADLILEKTLGVLGSAAPKNL